MTTPERLRRRQRIEGTFLVIIGIFMLVQFQYFQDKDEAQRACLVDVVADQNAALSRRGDIASQDAAVNAEESTATRALIVEAFASKTREEALAAFAKAQDKWAAVDKKRQQVAAARRSNPIPDFPDGTCD